MLSNVWVQGTDINDKMKSFSVFNQGLKEGVKNGVEVVCDFFLSAVHVEVDLIVHHTTYRNQSPMTITFMTTFNDHLEYDHHL